MTGSAVPDRVYCALTVLWVADYLALLQLLRCQRYDAECSHRRDWMEPTIRRHLLADKTKALITHDRILRGDQQVVSAR